MRHKKKEKKKKSDPVKKKRVTEADGQQSHITVKSVLLNLIMKCNTEHPNVGLHEK